LPIGIEPTRLRGSRRPVAIAGALAVLVAIAVGAWFLLRKDGAAPGTIDLHASEATETSIVLTWTAPGDDGASGQALAYDLRRSDASIDAPGWSGAAEVTGLSAPKFAGSSETFVVSGLTPDTDYYFAIRARDDADNLSPLSNVVHTRTSAPPPPTPLPPSHLIVITTPKDATVSLDGVRTAQGPVARFDSISAEPHTIEVTRARYVTQTQSVTTEPGLTATLEIALVKDTEPPPPPPPNGFGTLALEIDTPARVIVDGTERRSNVESLQLQLDPGSHTLRLEREGFLPRETTFEITAGRTTRLTMSMSPDIGTLVVKTNVNASGIYVDGRFECVGQGACTLKLTPGKHVVRVEAAAYDAQEKSVEVIAQKTVELEFKFVITEMGSLRVFYRAGDSKGQHAQIWLDGVKIDFPTPCRLDPVEPGNHKLVVEYNGVRGEATVLIRAGEMLEYDVTSMLER
jgi:chitodextrinase